MEKEDNIIFVYSMKDKNLKEHDDYIVNAICRRGECSFVYFGRKTIMHRQDIAIGSCRMFTEIVQSNDCMMEIILLRPQYVNSFHGLDYMIKCQMELYLNPVIHLTSEQMMVMRANFQFISYHLLHDEHKFYNNVVADSIRLMVLDLLNIRTQRHGLVTGSSRYTQLMKDFVALLENGEYRINHDADYFAEKLFVSAKHLSFVSRKTTGFSATYWINRFLQMDIRKKLYKHDATISELSKYYNFSSTSYFTRYVESNLGEPPKELQK